MKANTKKLVLVLDEIYEIDKGLGVYDREDSERKILGKFERIELEKTRQKMLKKANVFKSKVSEEEFENCAELSSVHYDGCTWEDFSENDVM